MRAVGAAYLPVSGAVGGVGGGKASRKNTFGGGGGLHCKNFLCTAVSGGSRGRAGVEV